MFQRLIIIIVASPWLKINHRISVKRDPDYSAPTCTSVWFPRMAVEKIQHKHVQACFPWGKKKKKKAVHTAPIGEASLVSLLLSPITLVWSDRVLPSANYFQTQLGSGTGPRWESMLRLARLRFWLKPHCAFLSQSQQRWAYYLHGPFSWSKPRCLIDGVETRRKRELCVRVVEIKHLLNTCLTPFWTLLPSNRMKTQVMQDSRTCCS